MKSCDLGVFQRLVTAFNRDIRPKLGIPNWPQSPDIEQNSERGISDFRISGQSFIKKN